VEEIAVLDDISWTLIGLAIVGGVRRKKGWRGRARQVGEDCDVRVEPSGVVQGQELGAEVPFYVLFLLLVFPRRL
jgi:hypothetical protein